jgi:hypothetical protein
MLKRILEERELLGWLNLGRVLKSDVMVVELPHCIALINGAVRSLDCIKQYYVLMMNWKEERHIGCGLV